MLLSFCYRRNLFIKTYVNRCCSSNIDLPGGMSLDNFIYLTEKLSPFMKSTFDIKVTSVKKGNLQFIMPYRKHLIGNPMTFAFHGGVTATLLDHAGGFCAWSSLSNPRLTVSTVDLRIDYLAPARYKEGEDLFVEGIVIDQGAKLIRSDVTLYDSVKKEKKIACARGTFNIYEISGNDNMNIIIEKVKKQNK